MSAMHAGVMTTSTEMMYAQHVTLTWCPIREAWTACTRRRGRAERRETTQTETHRNMRICVPYPHTVVLVLQQELSRCKPQPASHSQQGVADHSSTGALPVHGRPAVEHGGR